MISFGFASVASGEITRGRAQLSRHRKVPSLRTPAAHFPPSDASGKCLRCRPSQQSIACVEPPQGIEEVHCGPDIRVILLQQHFCAATLNHNQECYAKSPALDVGGHSFSSAYDPSGGTMGEDCADIPAERGSLAILHYEL
jgi:hypothetical protein